MAPVRNNNKAIVLLSGGLDSATCLYQAKKDNSEVAAISFDYSQKHKIELKAAKKLAKINGIPHYIQKLDPAVFQGSALTDSKIRVPKSGVRKNTIPVTYVPGRNTLFLAFASSLCEGMGFNRIYIGVNALDYSGYPDCRPDFIKSMQKTIDLGTKRGIENKNPVKIITPLIKLSKKEIILLGHNLGVPFHFTHSCYDPVGDKPCGRCDSCLLRKKGFQEAGIADSV